MKYTDYPVQINNTTLPKEPESWYETVEVVENVNTTEAGTDVVDLMRADKLTVSASYKVSSTWLATFKGWADSTSSLTVKLFDSITQNYVTKTMRMRNYNVSYEKYSKNTSGTYGLWKVSFDLIEF